MSEWDELGILLAIHKHAHSIKRELQPISPRERSGAHRLMMRRNARIVAADFAKSLRVAA